MQLGGAFVSFLLRLPFLLSSHNRPVEAITDHIPIEEPSMVKEAN